MKKGFSTIYKKCFEKKYKENFARIHKQGFATIYIVLILFSLTLSILIIAEVASGYSAQSVAESITTSAGESMLGEYSRALFKRYGIFAVLNDEDYLKKRAKHFLEGSTIVTKGFVKLEPKTIDVYADNYPCLNTSLFSKELQKIALESLVKSGSKASEREERKIGSINLPSKLLGFSSRESVLLSGGIFEIEVEKLIEDEYILKMCSSKNNLFDDTYLAYEVEYVLFGYKSDDGNLASMRRSLYAIFFASEMAKAQPLPTEPASLAIVTAKAAIAAERDTNTVVDGGEVEGKDYAFYLRLFLSMLAKEEKLARLMDVMQINLNYIDGVIFTFKQHSFGFDMVVTFEKKVFVPLHWGYDTRTRTVEQTHKYK